MLGFPRQVSDESSRKFTFVFYHHLLRGKTVRKVTSCSTYCAVLGVVLGCQRWCPTPPQQIECISCRGDQAFDIAQTTTETPSHILLPPLTSDADVRHDEVIFANSLSASSTAVSRAGPAVERKNPPLPPFDCDSLPALYQERYAELASP